MENGPKNLLKNISTKFFLGNHKIQGIAFPKSINLSSSLQNDGLGEFFSGRDSKFFHENRPWPKDIFFAIFQNTCEGGPKS